MGLYTTEEVHRSRSNNWDYILWEDKREAREMNGRMGGEWEREAKKDGGWSPGERLEWGKEAMLQSEEDIKDLSRQNLWKTCWPSFLKWKKDKFERITELEMFSTERDKTQIWQWRWICRIALVSVLRRRSSHSFSSSAPSWDTGKTKNARWSQTELRYEENENTRKTASVDDRIVKEEWGTKRKLYNEPGKQRAHDLIQ